MKSYKVATKYEQNKLLSLFNEFDKVSEMEETDQYTQISISIFNHWLTKDEANQAFSRPARITKQKRRDNLHVNFYKVLLENMKVYGYKYVDYKNKFCFIKFHSKDDILEYIGAKQFFIVIPKIRSIIISGFDDTNHLYYQDEKFLDKIKPLIKKAHLRMI